jgi:hypothetical protein
MAPNDRHIYRRAGLLFYLALPNVAIAMAFTLLKHTFVKGIPIFNVLRMTVLPGVAMDSEATGGEPGTSRSGTLQTAWLNGHRGVSGMANANVTVCNI